MTISDISIPMEIIEDEDVFLLAKGANPDAITNVSHHAYQNNKKYDDNKSCSKDQELNSCSKNASMGSHCALKITKIIWTKGLRKKFLKAIGKLGIDNATPKKILELMKVDGLTRDQVSSHLQKHRILLKKIANANCGVQAASKPSLLESSMVKGECSNISSSMLNQEHINWPSYSGMPTTNPAHLDTSSSCFPIPETANFNVTISSPSTLSGSLAYEGYSMQTMTNNLDGQRTLIHDPTSMGTVANSVNSINSGFVHDLHGFIYHYGGCSPQIHPYKNIEMCSSSVEHLRRELGMSLDQENPTKVGNLSNSSFVENCNNFGNNYFSQNEFGEMGSFYGSDWNGNLENGIGEDDLVLTETDITSLLSYADDDNSEYRGTSNNLPVTLQPPNQDMNGVNFPNIVSYVSNLNEETTSINQHQTLDGCLPGFDSTSNMVNTSSYEEKLIMNPFEAIDQ
ncbi:hypothetical protein L1987_43010 [Smallanthus sonchifolius]|uniref:Uncharacterized protein n=1 Tax=Smallanthus sonchifolius TaxID=185202 RepID=A0ACB9GKG6_9ASTR|nr:hypothetical protein L1987_43010 [Smallanthus sonchifolius]